MQGTGLGGRITRKDVETFIASGGANAAPAAVQAAVPATTAALVARKKPANQPVRSSGIHLSASPQTPLIEAEGHNLDARNEHFIDVTPMRNAIASKMRQSVTEIPHAWTMIEVDVTNLVVLRNKVKDEFMRREGINLPTWRLC